MEIRVLRYFLTVVREESITKASEVLHITQPTLSRQLAQMEEEIGVKLFDRGTRKIKLTNVESYDFSGKTIVPFCTSGGSGIDSSAANLERLTSGATWLSGRRLNGSDSQDTVMEWINSLGLNFEG